MMKFIHKTVSLIVLAIGAMFTMVSIPLAGDLFRDPELGFGGALFLTLMAFGISFGFLYVGWRMWRSGKRTNADQPETVTHPSGASGFDRTQTFRTPFGETESAGHDAGQTKAVTVECPGCGAPVEVAPSKPGECEYCGNHVPYR